MKRPSPGIDEQFRSAIVDLLPALCKYARCLCRDRSAADDLVQDVVIKALTKAHLWKPGTNLKAWLVTIMRNTFLAGLRHTHAHLFSPLDPFDDRLATDGTDDTHLERLELEQAWRRLSADYREVLLLLFEGQCYKDIAARYQIPQGTVRSRLHRARHAFQREINGTLPCDDVAAH